MNTDKPITAIPTVYRGIELKSRMEAQCAVLLDKIGWNWEYEKCSFTLDSGISFRPDFWIPENELLLECRGYNSELGDRQIDEFGRLFTDGPGCVDVPGDKAHIFMVLGPDGVRVYNHLFNQAIHRLVISTGGFGYWHIDGLSVAAYSTHYAVALGASNGKILVNQQPLENATEFVAKCDEAEILRIDGMIRRSIQRAAGDSK